MGIVVWRIAAFVLCTGFAVASVQAQQAEGVRGSDVAEAAATATVDLSEQERLIVESLQQDAAAGADALLKMPAPLSAGASAGVGVGLRAGLQSLNPDMSVILDAAAAYFSQEPLQLGAHDPNKTGFTLQQLEVHLGANVDPFFRMDANIVFAQFGVEVEEVYGTTLSLPWDLQVRAGQFLTRIGRINATHPHSWHFVDQPLVNGRFLGSEGSRGLGGELSWLTPLPWYVEVVGSVGDAAGECCARSFYGGDDLGVDTLSDLLYTTAVKQFFALTDSWSLAWGISGQFGPNPTGNGNRTEIYGSDLYLRFRPVDAAGRKSVSLTIEALYRTRQIPYDVLRDWGMYSQLVWEVNQRWEVGARYETVSGVEGDPLDPEATSARQRVSAQATFFPSHFSRIRLQSHYDAPGWLDKPVVGAMLALELVAGAHGAHAY